MRLYTRPGSTSWDTSGAHGVFPTSALALIGYFTGWHANLSLQELVRYFIYVSVLLGITHTVYPIEPTVQPRHAVSFSKGIDLLVTELLFKRYRKNGDLRK